MKKRCFWRFVCWFVLINGFVISYMTIQKMYQRETTANFSDKKIDIKSVHSGQGRNDSKETDLELSEFEKKEIDLIKKERKRPAEHIHYTHGKLRYNHNRSQRRQIRGQNTQKHEDAAKIIKESNQTIGDRKQYVSWPNQEKISANAYARRSNAKLLEVYVVEEHHEVIPYWFNAAERGIIPKSGNTLVHIDGHSDMGIPFFIPGYPHFRWPMNGELKYFMQSNDIFILAAGMTGLLDRVIWVWPEWDRPNHDSDYRRITVSLGMKSRNSAESRANIGFDICMCHANDTYRECRYFSLDENVERLYENRTFEGFPIPEKNCSIKKTLVYEEINEKKAEVNLMKQSWIKPAENVFLDLDEDYYGCTYAIQPLLTSNLTLEAVQTLSYFIQVIFCPKTTVQEQESDMFLSEILSFLYTERVCSAHPISRPSFLKCNRTSYMDLYAHFSEYLKNLTSKAFINLCSLKYNIKAVVHAVVAEFSKLSTEQIKALYKVGFCSNTTPKTYTAYNNRTFGVCFGANTPQNTAVYEHTPTMEEIRSRSLQLGRILRLLSQYSPKLVTLCRSVRDGYTPRQYFRRIENDMIYAINSSLNKNSMIYYDADLLGGKRGWGFRTKPEAILRTLSIPGVNI